MSKIVKDQSVDAELRKALDEFHVRMAYKPDASDYFVMASLLFPRTPGLAAPYYKRARSPLTPADSKDLSMHRAITDQLVMSLGMSGDLKQSRLVAQHAIEADPDYPLNYYNLACADAEQGDAEQARVHLEQGVRTQAEPDQRRDHAGPREG